MLLLLAGVFGLLLGSFTNVLIARIPHGEQWATGASRCPRCRHEIAWYDNIPVVSWLILRGRCRHCHERISPLYPLVEIVVAVLVILSASVYGTSLVTGALAILSVTTVALAVIDFRTMRLPTPLVWGSLAVVAPLTVVDAALTDAWWDLARAAAGAAILGGVYFLLWFAVPHGLGFGDVRLAVLLGFASAYLSWAALAVAGIAGPVLGAVAAIVAVARARRLRGVRMPFGPWMIAAFWLGALAGVPISDWYVAWVSSW